MNYKLWAFLKTPIVMLNLIQPLLFSKGIAGRAQSYSGLSLCCSCIRRLRYAYLRLCKCRPLRDLNHKNSTSK
jgi:hypothetical protein